MFSFPSCIEGELVQMSNQELSRLIPAGKIFIGGMPLHIASELSGAEIRRLGLRGRVKYTAAGKLDSQIDFREPAPTKSVYECVRAAGWISDAERQQKWAQSAKAFLLPPNRFTYGAKLECAMRLLSRSEIESIAAEYPAGGSNSSQASFLAGHVARVSDQDDWQKGDVTRMALNVLRKYRSYEMTDREELDI